MNDTSANPIFMALLFILRCIVPLAVLFGISYLLRKMGLVAAEAPEPPDDRDNGGTDHSASQNGTEAAQPGITGPGPNGKETVEKTRRRSQ